MECPKCGAILEEDSKFCTSCGENLNSMEKTPGANSTPVSDEDRSDVNVSQSTSETGDIRQDMIVDNGQGLKIPKMNKVDIIGLITGTIIIVIGIIRIIMAGTSISSTSFGGDFYTYTYQGIVAVSEILASIEVSLGWIIVAIGAAIDVVSLYNSLRK